VLLGYLEELLDLFMQVAVVALERKKIVSFFCLNRFGNFRLTSHGVNGDNTALELQHPQQLWDGAHAKGMTDAQFAELLAVVGLACETNRLAIGYGVPVDERFLPK